MKRFFLTTAVLLGTFLASQGCSTVPSATGEDEMICTPGNFVFCKCADASKGTKLCRSDGMGFEACTVRDSGTCSEVQDRDTNKEVDGNGDVIPDDDDSGDDDNAGPTDLDTCPGKPVAVAPGVEILLENDTSRALNDRRGKVGGACAAANGSKDFIYHLIPSGTGSLEVKVQGQGALDPIVYVRSTCDDESTQAACGPQSGNKTATTKLSVTTGRDYFLFVDGASGASGAFTATVKLTAGSFCGDGNVNDGEACDDGNHAEGDGCNANCRGVDGDPVVAGSCPGQEVHLWKNATVRGNGSTSNFKSSLNTPNKSTCVTLPASGTNTTADHVYQIIPHASGNLRVTLAAQSGTPLSPDLFLTAHDTCTATAFTTSCTTGATPLEYVVTADKPVFIAVEGGTAANQKYAITFNLK